MDTEETYMFENLFPGRVIPISALGFNFSQEFRLFRKVFLWRSQITYKNVSSYEIFIFFTRQTFSELY